MNPASYRRGIRQRTYWFSSRELLGFSGVQPTSLLLCVVPLLASAAGRQKNQADSGLLFPPSPRPSGRSPHRPLIFLQPKTRVPVNIRDLTSGLGISF